MTAIGYCLEFNWVIGFLVMVINVVKCLIGTVIFKVWGYCVVFAVFCGVKAI